MSITQQQELVSTAHELMDHVSRQLDLLFLRHCEAAGRDPAEVQKEFDNL